MLNETKKVICPKCNEESSKDITGWCPIYSEPIINGQCITGPDRQMCYPGCISDFSYDSKRQEKIFHCSNCDIFFNLKGKIKDWNSVMGMTDLYECDLQDIQEYTDELISHLGIYDKTKTSTCIENRFYIEAVVSLNRHIGDQLRFLLIKQIKGKLNIPLDQEDSRFKEIVPLLKRMDDSILIKFAFIYERIDEKDKGFLSELNTTRHLFVHSFNKLKRDKLLSSGNKLKSLIENCQKIEEKLSKLIDEYK